MQKQVPVTCSWCRVPLYRNCTQCTALLLMYSWTVHHGELSPYHQKVVILLLFTLLYDTRFLFAEKLSIIEQNRSKVTFKNTTSLIDIEWLYPSFHHLTLSTNKTDWLNIKHRTSVSIMPSEFNSCDWMENDPVWIQSMLNGDSDMSEIFLMTWTRRIGQNEFRKPQSNKNPRC